MSFISFIGYWIFTIYGGIGLTALPMDLITEFINRPKLVSSKEAAENKISLKARNNTMITQLTQLKEDQKELQITEGFFNKRSKKSKLNNAFKKIKSEVIKLESDLKIFDLEMDFGETNPIPFYAKLLLGIFLIIMSFFWWIHIIVFVLDESGNFFNNMLMGLESGNAMFISVSIIFGLSFYMLMVTMKGTFKVGVKIPYLISFHLMM